MESTEFTEYFLSIRDLVLRTARCIMGNDQDAEDAVSDIYEKFYLKRDDIERYDNLHGVIMTSVRNLCYDRIKKSSRRRELNKTVFPTPRITVPQYDGDIADIMERLIDSLPEKQRQAIRLREIEGMEFSQIASITSMSQSAVRVCICRARNTLRKEMEKIMNHGVR